MTSAVRGDFGLSWSVAFGQPVKTLIETRLGNTLLLMTLSAIFSLAIALPVPDVNTNGIPDECEIPCNVPIILRQPISQTACEFDAVTLLLIAQLDPPPAYQWRKDGLGIPGATSLMLTLAPARPEDSGAYDVVVSNDCDFIVSDAATGETYIVGSDGLMRSDSRFSETSTILSQKVDTATVTAALDGLIGPSDVSDGISSTIMCGEKRVNGSKLGTPQLGEATGWASGFGVATLRNGGFLPMRDADDPYELVADQFGSAHPRSSNFLFCDGSVHGIRGSVDLETLHRLAVRNDGLPVTIPE